VHIFEASAADLTHDIASQFAHAAEHSAVVATFVDWIGRQD
jgi:hypothetical protein